MKVSLLKQSHEDMWLREGHLLSMQFLQGWVCVRILGLEGSNVKPYVLSASLAAGTALAAWDDLLDASNRRYTEPPANRFIHHYFWGVNKPAVRIYFQYPSRQDRNALVAIQRAVGGDVGYVDGNMSPYQGPFSAKTEFFTVKELYTAFQAHNPLADAMPLVALNLDVMRYTYEILTDPEEVKAILLGKRQRRLYTMAGIDPNPAEVPQWLRTLADVDLVVGGKPEKLMDWTLKVMEGRA